MQKLRRATRFLAVIAVVAAGTGVVANAASLTLSSKSLGANKVAVSACTAGSVTVTLTTTGAGANKKVSEIGLTLTASCAGAGNGATAYAMLDNTTAAVSGKGTCTLTTPGPACTGAKAVTLSTAVKDVATDDYTLIILASPGTAQTSSTGHNGLKLATDYLTLRDCTSTTGPPTTC
ncbi:MAG: hypothetical protein WCB85_06005 [Candidatus Dormiibacterota bacterium]